MASVKDWIQAFRLRTLPLAVSSIIVGSALARNIATADQRIALLAIVTAILLQILSNLANDLGDHEHGTDNVDRLGPERSMQKGSISKRQMKMAMAISGALALISGIFLIVTAFGFSFESLAFLGIGLSAIYAAVRYTYGKNPYGYAGFGDAAVFLFFGIVGVLGTYYLHTKEISSVGAMLGSTFGCLSAAVLNLNNMRDIENDQRMGKRTLAVILGPSGSRVYHSLLILTAMACIPFALKYTNANLDVTALIILSIPLTSILIVWVAALRSTGKSLDRLLPAQAMSTFLLALMIAYVLLRN